MSQHPVKPLSQLVEPGWAAALQDVEPQVHHMGDFLRSELQAGRQYLPASHNILRAFTIPFDSIKVLIVGQDPYPTPGHPVGLSFCVAPDVRPLPKSLVNIYRELVDDMHVPMPANGDLTPWTQRGVMLLNRCLTVGVGRPNSHQGKGWRPSPRPPSAPLTPGWTRTASRSRWWRSSGAQRAEPRAAAHQRDHHRLAASQPSVRIPRVLRLPPVLPRQPSAGLHGRGTGRLVTAIGAGGSARSPLRGCFVTVRWAAWLYSPRNLQCRPSSRTRSP